MIRRRPGEVSVSRSNGSSGDPHATNCNRRGESRNNSRPYSLYLVIIIGIIFHVVYLASIFDIYFKTPLVHGMEPYAAPVPPPAKRLVLISADGCRADKFFELDKDGKTVTPFLRSIIDNEGSWGVSHTRVPTESRPGHVALIAGFYEDVSAVTTGWKVNPVDFDSVFNQSNHVWQIGSPDVVRIFGLNDPHIEAEYYEEEMEDFAAADPTSLDKWVFDHFEQLLNKAKNDPELDAQIRQEKNIFFLHLLGIDTSGHAYRPSGKGYIDNIRFVDEGVKKVYEMVENYFGDKKTAYIFTADHGMTTKGSHGDGHPECTRTPIVVWGAGVRSAGSNGLGKAEIIPDGLFPTYNDMEEEKLYVMEQWGLDASQRKDVRQADVAPLMAALLGIKYPVNNVGVLPLSYLDGDENVAVQNLFTNAKQISAQLQTKARLKQAHALFFRPFKPTDPVTGDPIDLDALVPEIESLIARGQYAAAQQKCQQLIELSIQGLNYFQKYDWVFLKTVIVTGYISWMGFILVYALKHYTAFGETFIRTAPQKRHTVLNVAALVVFASFAVGLAVQKSPLLYHFYVAFPILFINRILSELPLLRAFLQSSLTFAAASPSASGKSTRTAAAKTSGKLGSFGRLLRRLVTYGVALELMVVGYYRREIFSLSFILLMAFPFVVNVLFSARERLTWVASCLVMSTFTLMPPDYGSHTALVCAGGAAIIVMTVLADLCWYKSKVAKNTAAASKRHLFQRALFFVQVILTGLATWVVYSTEAHLARKEGLPRLNQLLAWGTSAFSMALPLVSSNEYLIRTRSIFLGFACPFIFMSISYEVLFYASLGMMLMMWIYLEKKIRKSGQRENELQMQQQGALTPTIMSPSSPSAGGVVVQAADHKYLQHYDFNTALFFIFFFNVAFFGTGNLATVGSFELSSVYRFTTVFAPFLMGAILIFKILIPLLLVTAVFLIIMRVTNAPQFGVFLLVLAMSDVMTMNFFFQVTDYGSWLEIGNSISRFAILSAMTVFVLILFSLMQAFTWNVTDYRHPVAGVAGFSSLASPTTAAKKKKLY